MQTHIHLNYLGRLITWIVLLLVGVLLLAWLLFTTPSRGAQQDSLMEQISFTDKYSSS
jgi:hypothetical protein